MYLYTHTHTYIHAQVHERAYFGLKMETDKELVENLNTKIKIIKNNITDLFTLVHTRLNDVTLERNKLISVMDDYEKLNNEVSELHTAMEYHIQLETME